MLALRLDPVARALRLLLRDTWPSFRVAVTLSVYQSKWQAFANITKPELPGAGQLVLHCEPGPTLSNLSRHLVVKSLCQVADTQSLYVTHKLLVLDYCCARVQVRGDQ